MRDLTLLVLTVAGGLIAAVRRHDDPGGLYSCLFCSQQYEVGRPHFCGQLN